MTTYLDIHILQDIPPANLNRDDTGSPKSARYGGVDRLRVSSQAWKRATRKAFQETLGIETLGVRTRRVQESFRSALTDAGVPEETAQALAPALVGRVFGKTTGKAKKEGESSYLLFFSRPQLAQVVAEVLARRDEWDDPAAVAAAIDVPAILGQGHSLDVALFGRMVADMTQLNVDAAAQVGHALATHPAPTQFDYFTAVDDLQEKDEAGAGMIGTVEFNSATLYRYASVNLESLIENMASTTGAVDGAVEFVRAFASSLPTGKQNTFAAHTRPQLLWCVVRDDRPVNHMSAFERPVQAGRDGYVTQSITTLARFVTDEANRWGDVPVAQFATYVQDVQDPQVVRAFGPSLSFNDLLGHLRDVLAKRVDHA